MNSKTGSRSSAKLPMRRNAAPPWPPGRALQAADAGRRADCRHGFSGPRRISPAPCGPWAYSRAWLGAPKSSCFHPTWRRRRRGKGGLCRSKAADATAGQASRQPPFCRRRSSPGILTPCHLMGFFRRVWRSTSRRCRWGFCLILRPPQRPTSRFCCAKNWHPRWWAQRLPMRSR